ncbi:MAG TPA: hypothetical protein VMP03_12150 [Methylomirabilota bacterium]|nr:hypothetical protein [Methylomirabilota bacterium]
MSRSRIHPRSRTRLRRSLVYVGVAFTLFGLPHRAAAQYVVDFEPNPMTGRFPDGSMPVDEMPIGDQFLLSHGIRFGIDVDGDGSADGPLPLLERRGENPPDAFFNGLTRLFDSAMPGYEDQLGEWFLKADLKDGSQSLIIAYEAPVEAASGQIWDIDGAPIHGYEQWRVEALDRAGAVIDSVDSPVGDTLELDGRPWDFTVRSPSGHRLAAVRIRFIGRKRASTIGLAFDRYTPFQSAFHPGLTPPPSVISTPSPTTTTPRATATGEATPTLPPIETPVPSLSTLFYFPIVEQTRMPLR